MLNSSNAISHLILTAILDLVITVIPFLQWEEPRSERLRNSPKVTQLKRLGVRIPRMYPLDVWGFPGKESACQCRRHKTQEFAPWVKKIPWRRKWQPTPVFLPGKSRGGGAWRATICVAAKSWTRLSDGTHAGLSMWGIKQICTEKQKHKNSGEIDLFI